MFLTFWMKHIFCPGSTLTFLEPSSPDLITSNTNYLLKPVFFLILTHFCPSYLTWTVPNLILAITCFLLTLDIVVFLHGWFLKSRLLLSTETLKVFHGNIYDMSWKVTSGYATRPVNLRVALYLKCYSDRRSLEF